MNSKRTTKRQGPAQRKAELLQVRLSGSEKQAFENAAAVAGISLSSWVRERLRWAATKELQGAGRSVAFLE
jgi:predicted HicB family RNase H-like nuclease